MTGPLILIADDNRDTREMYAYYLDTRGYRVETAVDGREAVAKALTLHPDLIVMDLEMPDVDGWKAMRALRGDPATATIPFIVLTGHDLKDYLKRAALAVGPPERLAREIEVRLRGRGHT